MKGKQAIYWVVLLIGLGAIMLAYYFLQSREPTIRSGPVNLETMRMRLDTAEHSVNSTMAYQLMDMAVTAQIEGKLTDDQLHSLDQATAQATLDDMVTDHELLAIADPISRATKGKPVTSRDDVRVLLSK